MSIPTKQIDNAWKKIGMVFRDTGDRHAKFYEKGKLVLTTLRSLGSGKLPDYIGYRIRQQMRLNEDQFADLIACPLKRDGYVEILKKKGLI